ncbi:phage protease [Pseudomonas citronellolis]|uniref:Phage protease n=1 Tax=Pseudomonas citronellolis TaxID=53408 RepID=A0AAW6P1Q5_9PSED|nr:phage protease [Pseudomonas citronellolis]MDF3840477.1 phage protease [Pseudomonas citronellolis]WRT82950.1 phage protease [Pseudomonas citronellolis]
MNKQAPQLHREVSTALCFELSAEVPEWVEVLPPGPTVTGRDGRQWTYDPHQVIAATTDHAAGADLPFDYLHATELKAPLGEKAPASGWAKEYRINERGALEARVEWTAAGHNAIQAREYRYVSPVFMYDSSGRIDRFSSFALVTKPNLIIKALNAEGAPSQPPEVNAMDLAAILAALGLPDTATAEDAVGAINKLLGDKEALQSAANSEKVPSLDKYVPRQDFSAMERRALNAEQLLAQQKKDDLEKAINAEIEAALTARKITPATKDYHLAACREDGGLERFRDFVKAAPPVTDPVVPDGEYKGGQKALNAEEQAAAKAFGWTEEQYIEKTKGVK